MLRHLIAVILEAVVVASGQMLIELLMHYDLAEEVEAAYSHYSALQFSVEVEVVDPLGEQPLKMKILPQSEANIRLQLVAARGCKNFVAFSPFSSNFRQKPLLSFFPYHLKMDKVSFPKVNTSSSALSFAGSLHYCHRI